MTSPLLRSTFLVLVATCGAACIPPPAAEPPVQSAARARRPREGEPRQLHPSLKSVLLPSGMWLLLDEDPSATTAGVVSVVTGGSTNDPAGAEGLAHLVEHLTFRAVDPQPTPPAPPATRWDRLIRYAVAEMNGFTTKDCLIFYEFGPAQRLDSLLAFETARLSDPLVGVDDDAVAVERLIVGSEHLMREDPRAGGWAANALLPRLFPPGHPYARSPGGTEESRRRLTLAQAKAYAVDTFRPDRMTLLVAAPPGVTSLSALTDKLPAALRGDAGHPVARPPLPKGLADDTVPAKAATVERRSSPLPTPELWIGWRLPGAVGDVSATEEVLEQWVQEDVGSDQVLQEEPKIRHIRATLQPGTGASVLLLRVLVAKDADPDRVAQVVTARVASLWSREPTEQDTFADLKRLYETQQLLDEPAQVSRALNQALVAARTEQPASMAKVWDALQSVSSAAVAKLAYQHLTRDKARAVMFTPAPVSPEATRHAAAAAASVEAATTHELVPGAAAWDPKELQAFLPAPAAVATKKLENGLTVITVRRPGTAVVAWLAFRGGYSDTEPPLLVELAARVRPDARQATKLHILPGRGATRDMSFDVVQFLPAQLPEALTLLFAKATVPVKEWPTREGLARILAPIAAQEDALTTKMDAAFWRTLFGDHPHARVVTTEDVEKVTHSDLDAWLGRVHASRNAALVVIGDVEPAEVEHAATILSAQIKSPAWVADLATPPAVETRPAGAERVVPVVTARPGALTDIRLACLLPSMTGGSGTYDLLKQAVQARLNAVLRSDRGDSYGVDVDVERLRGGTTYLVASTFVGDENLNRSVAALHNQWQRWARQGFDAAEINVARWRLAATLPFRNANGYALAFQLLNEWNTNPGRLREGSSQRTVFPNVGALRAERVNELFATCKSNTVLGLTGSEALIQRALDQSWPALAPRAHASSN